MHHTVQGIGGGRSIWIGSVGEVSGVEIDSPRTLHPNVEMKVSAQGGAPGVSRFTDHCGHIDGVTGSDGYTLQTFVYCREALEAALTCAPVRSRS